MLNKVLKAFFVVESQNRGHLGGAQGPIVEEHLVQVAFEGILRRAEIGLRARHGVYPRIGQRHAACQMAIYVTTEECSLKRNAHMYPLVRIRQRGDGVVEKVHRGFGSAELDLQQAVRVDEKAKEVDEKFALNQINRLQVAVAFRVHQKCCRVVAREVDGTRQPQVAVAQMNASARFSVTIFGESDNVGAIFRKHHRRDAVQKGVVERPVVDEAVQKR